MTSTMIVTAVPDRFHSLLWDLQSFAGQFSSTTTTHEVFNIVSSLNATWIAILASAIMLARWIWSRTASIMDRICSRTYIYNCCWEDPAVDHEILRIQPTDVIFRICSAGDIVLDYAIEGPAKIVVCDMNQHQ